MRIFLFTVCLCVINLLNAQNSIEYVKFSGKIINYKGNEVKIYSGNKYLKVISLNEDGAFSDTLHVKKGMYTFRDKNEITPIYLAPGYDLTITLDTKEFDESIVYTGLGAKTNTFLSELFLYNEINEVNYFQAKELSDEEYFKYNINLYKGATLLLDSMQLDDSEFCSLQKKKMYYESLYKLISHKKSEVFTDNSYNSDYCHYVKDALDKIDLKDSIEYANNINYKYLILAYYEYGLLANNKEIRNNFLNLKKSDVYKAVLSRLDRNISIRTENYQDYYNTLITLSKDSAYLQSLTAKYNMLLKLKLGNPSPTFTCDNYNGEITSLSDFKGDLVYIDLWATWCGPCKDQIPFLNELEDKYKDKGISFVSISIDKIENIDKWKQMIKEKEMGGVQLIAENAWKSDFTVAYSVKAIPRFILLDQSGNIIDANAPRPLGIGEEGPVLNNEIISLIDQYLK